MEDPDNIHTLTNITTLKEARQEISRLLEFQKKAYYFLDIFCAYDIGEPLLAANACAKELQKEDLSQQHSDYLIYLLEDQERIKHTNRVVIRAAKTEDGGEKRLEFLKTNYPSEALDINSALEGTIQQIKENVERHNYQYTHANENWEPTQVKVKLANRLPTAQCNSSMLDGVLSDLAWFMTEVHNQITEITVTTDFDEQWAKIIFRCSTLDPHRYVFVLEEFERFNGESTFFNFNPISLFLYNSWHTLKMYNGLLGFSVQDNTEIRKLSIAEATVYLKR